MRGIVYRLGRRRTGSVLAAFGVALAFALGSVSGASAKAVTPAQVIPVPVHVVPVPVIPAPVHVVPVAPPKPPAKVVQVVQVVQTVQTVQLNTVAHAAGHKVA
jgi:hypothetical protein